MAKAKRNESMVISTRMILRQDNVRIEESSVIQPRGGSRANVSLQNICMDKGRNVSLHENSLPQPIYCDIEALS